VAGAHCGGPAAAAGGSQCGEGYTIIASGVAGQHAASQDACTARHPGADWRSSTRTQIAHRACAEARGAMECARLSAVRQGAGQSAGGIGGAGAMGGAECAPAQDGQARLDVAAAVVCARDSEKINGTEQVDRLLGKA